MATDTSQAQVPRPWEPDQGTATGAMYDRSSLKGDYMVMLAGQTAEDFEKYAPERQFCEYFDGIVYMPSPVSQRHQEQALFLYDLLNGLRCERGGGTVLTGPAVLRLSEDRKPEPDVFVLPPAGSPPLPPALFVIEILSASTRGHDLGRKFDAYRGAGIPEIWMFDEREKKVIAERHGANGQYVREVRSEGLLASSAIQGFWIDICWLWDEPLPNPRRCLERILADPPAVR